jgi:hypothetical protein
VHGEYTNLLLEEHIGGTTFSTSGRLYFDEGTIIATQNEWHGSKMEDLG